MGAGSISISSTRRRTVPDWFLRWLCALDIIVLLALSVPAYGADAFEGRLDEILRRNRAGVVRIEARRAWNALVSDSSKVDQRFQPVLRVSGNGIVWDGAEHVITISDLAQPGDSLAVFTADGKRLRGIFLRQDPEAGISLIQVNGLASLVQPIVHEQSGFNQDRHWVLTLGAPNGRSGMELDLARVLGAPTSGPKSLIRLEGRLDPGFAGGPVLCGDGGLIGILMGEGDETLLLGERAADQPIEFGLANASGPSEAGWIIPIDELEASAKALLNMRSSGVGFLGVRVDLSTAAKDGPPALGPGLPIARVLSGSPAENAGVRAGDLLVGFGGLPVVSWDELTERVAGTEPGRQVRIDVIRAGRPLAIQVKMADRGHMLWQAKQRTLAGARERILRRQIDDLYRQLQLLKRQLGSPR